MPIIDYGKTANTVEKKFFANNKISNNNKGLIRKFLDMYSVKASREIIFLNHITLLLERIPDIKKDMHNSEKINKVFLELRNKLSPAYYSTVINVSSRFVRWLNDGEKPKGFKDIKNVPKKDQKRKLSPKDMVKWEDGEKITESTNSIQLKAIIATQLDGGFRPSEFVDLNYGDVSIKKDFIIVEVKDGKTGSRNVILWRSVPHLLKWLEAHPSKKRNDPLWTQEYYTKGKVLRYKYYAMQKMVRRIFQKAKMDKPCDFYNLRHSACVISKKDNVPEELAASKFGHSVDYYVNTYGRLSTDDIMGRYSKHYGLEEMEKTVEQNIKCRCGFINEPKSEVCSRCGNILSLKKALELKGETEKQLEDMGKKIEEMDKIIARNVVRSFAKYDNVPLDKGKEKVVKQLIEKLFEKGVLNPKDFVKNI